MKHIAASIAALLFVSLSTASAVVGESSVSLDPLTPKQGQTLVVRTRVPAGQPVPTVEFNKKSYKLFPVGADGSDEYRALIGVPADLPAGAYKLSVGGAEQAISVKAGSFPVQHIRLPKDKDNFIASPGEREQVQAAKETVSDAQLWKGKFQRPSPARTSSAFGLRRMVNGRLLKDYFHSGLDYAGGLGSPVYATQRGRVLIAANKGWRLHGNTVAIDHGQGVVSFYIHLSKVLVKPGQMVDAGEQIGKIGSTGRASGPHLHFSLYVNGDATSPSEWYTRSM
jgi:murein DD-endopeptidase MepM/ murein hydrolase activator NlpD